MWSWWLRPHESDPFFAQWPTMDRFAKLCWYWRVDNHHLRTSIGNTVRFEDITSDYECFEQRILRPFGLIIPQSVWKQQAGVQRNPTGTPIECPTGVSGMPTTSEPSRPFAAKK